jgi:hypothetical protein
VAKTYRMAPTPAGQPVRKPRARKRAKGAPTHVRSWPLRPDAGQCRVMATRFFTGVRVYNAVLGEFIGRSRKVKADPAWQAAREAPQRTATERKDRGAAFRAVEQAHGFTADAAQSYASSLRKSWVREHLPAQETQNLGARAFDAVRQWHVGSRGKPRFKNPRRGLHSLAAKDGHGALRPKTDAVGRLVGLQWGAGFVIPIAPTAASGRRGKDQQAELTEIETLIAAGKVLSTRIVRTVINGRDTYRLQLVCDGNPTRRHTTALSQTCLCGNRKNKPLSQRVHRCGCGITEARDLFSAYLGLHVRTQVDGSDRLDLQAAQQGWLHRHDVDGPPKSSRSTSSKRRGRRHPPSRRSVARINARRTAKAAMRQSLSARTSTADQPTAIAA